MMDALWDAIADLMADYDLWRGNAPADYGATVYIVGRLEWQDGGDDTCRAVSIVLDVYGDGTAHSTADAIEELLTGWRVQDELPGASSCQALLELRQELTDESDPRRQRVNMIFTLAGYSS